MLEISKIITREQLCEQLGISANTLRRWIKERNFPHPLNASGRRPFFDCEDKDQKWLEEHKKYQVPSFVRYAGHAF